MFTKVVLHHEFNDLITIGISPFPHNRSDELSLPESAVLGLEAGRWWKWRDNIVVDLKNDMQPVGAILTVLGSRRKCRHATPKHSGRCEYPEFQRDLQGPEASVNTIGWDLNSKWREIKLSRTTYDVCTH